MSGRTSERDHSDTNWDGPIRDAAIGVAEAVQTTLGPNGMDKMVIGENGTVIVTNDGSSILDWMEVSNPVGRLVERVAHAQDDTIGDGTTTTVVLAAALLKEAAALQEKGVHPTTIVDGYESALETARDCLDDYEIPIESRDDDRLAYVAQTAVTGRWDADSTARFADLTLEALRRIEFDTSKLTLKSYPGGELHDSECLDGILVDLESSSTALEGPEYTRLRRIQSPAIGMVDGEIGIPEPDHVESVQFETAAERDAYQTHERDRREDIIAQVQQSEASVLFSQKAIDETVRTALVKRDVLPVERTRRDEFDVIARASGATPVTSVAELTASDTGTVASVEQRTVGTTDTLVLRGCPDEHRASLLLRGGTPHVAEEVRRIIAGCVDVTRLSLGDGTLLPGGGAVPTGLAMDLTSTARGIADRQQLVYDGFAAALDAIPQTLAENAGSDPIGVLTTLKQRHDAGTSTVGIGPDGRPREMVEAGVLEPSSVFGSSLQRAVAVATMVLRIDDIVHVGTGETEHDNGEHNHAATGGYPWAVGH